MAPARIPTSKKPSLFHFYKVLLIIPSFCIESISPMMKRCLLSLFSNSLLRSLLSDQLERSARRFLSFFLSFFLSIFIAHFLQVQEFALAPGIQTCVKFMLNLNTLFKHTFVCLITHSFICVFNSNLGQSFPYVYSISAATFNLM